MKKGLIFLIIVLFFSFKANAGLYHVIIGSWVVDKEATLNHFIRSGDWNDLVEENLKKELESIQNRQIRIEHDGKDFWIEGEGIIQKSELLVHSSGPNDLDVDLVQNNQKMKGVFVFYSYNKLRMKFNGREDLEKFIWQREGTSEKLNYDLSREGIG